MKSLSLSMDHGVLGFRVRDQEIGWDSGFSSTVHIVLLLSSDQAVRDHSYLSNRDNNLGMLMRSAISCAAPNSHLPEYRFLLNIGFWKILLFSFMINSIRSKWKLIPSPPGHGGRRNFSVLRAL